MLVISRSEAYRTVKIHTYNVSGIFTALLYLKDWIRMLPIFTPLFGSVGFHTVVDPNPHLYHLRSPWNIQFLKWPKRPVVKKEQFLIDSCDKKSKFTPNITISSVCITLFIENCIASLLHIAEERQYQKLDGKKQKSRPLTIKYFKVLPPDLPDHVYRWKISRLFYDLWWTVATLSGKETELLREAGLC